ncbi:hypothetical protein DH2020_014079 [Rehmannia glutinosa]|uniref:Afadin/alpha-actinin-binding protein n=1 Tax=Rehmannia glutinosa TaxID=99300 RepID=A0ABR0WYV6_REHGL
MPPTDIDSDLRVASLFSLFVGIQFITCSTFSFYKWWFLCVFVRLLLFPLLQRSSVNPTTVGMSEYAFADINNLEHCAKYLNQTLVTFGFTASLDLFSNDPVSVARTCNCMYALLQQRQRDIEFRESANEQRQRLLSDISRLEAKVERLEAQLSAKDRDIATMTRTEAKATAAFKAQIDKLQQERDEFQKMVLGNQERLNQVLMEKKKESRSGMEIMNLLQVDAYEAKNQELVAENADLRALLRSMQQLSVTFSAISNFKERMVQLQDAQKGSEVTSEVTERELELEAQLVEARSIIQEQASIMSKHLAKPEKPRRLSGHLSSDRDSILLSPSELLYLCRMAELLDVDLAGEIVL